MSLLARFGILTKVLSVIGLMGLIIVCSVYFATSRMSQIDDGYTRFLEREALAWVTSARLNRNVYRTWYFAYRAIAETSEDEIAKAETELRKTFEETTTLTKLVKDNAKGLEAAVDAIEAKSQELGRLMGPMMALAVQNRNDEAVAYAHATLDPKFQAIAKDAADLRTALDKMIKTGSGDLSAMTGRTISLTQILAGAGLVIGVVLAALIAIFGIVRPIRSLVACMETLASGKYDIEVPGNERKDEVGTMAKMVEVFRKNGIEVENMRTEQAEQQKRDSVARRAERHRLADDFEQAVGNIVATVSSASAQLEQAASTLTQNADSTQQLSGIVASASEEASSNVQAVASATEELSSSVGEIGRHVQESSNISAQAVQQAQKTDARINELSQAAARIGDVVKLITAIAEQTNLLALNATIEAARAGEAGRGFAVVASEVKQLASQTAKATEEISAQIAGMQTATQDSVASIKEIGGTIARIAEIAGAIATAVEEQGAATGEIARNVGQAAKGTQQVAENITAVNRGASETGSASAQVLASARALTGESNNLKREVTKFLTNVRA
ncbi:MAG: methyl-accepting chemotaxis sensory transducer [Xanthobacteraceae bacterium]|jgi:methyl-accepting chemotaxis protein|nr:methyl-accepting chemotaxis sensory transducer [Xanthobacteraceae bacterium]